MIFTEVHQTVEFTDRRIIHGVRLARPDDLNRIFSAGEQFLESCMIGSDQLRSFISCKPPRPNYCEYVWIKNFTCLVGNNFERPSLEVLFAVIPNRIVCFISGPV